MTQIATLDLPDYQPDLRRIRSDIGQLETDQELLEARVRSLETDDRTEELEQLVRELRDQLDETVGDVRALETGLRRARTDISWLSGHVVALAGLTRADLDRAGDRERELVATVLQGHKARSTVLSEHHRDVLRRQITNYKTKRDLYVETTGRAVEHLETLAEQGLTAAEGIETSHIEQRNRARQLVAEARALKDDYEAAQRDLAEDDKQRQKIEPFVQAGAKAGQHLYARLRTRIDKAVREQKLLPSWLTRVLGPSPDPLRREMWLDAAATILVYRITYDLHDPDVALGASPIGTGRQYADYQHALQMAGQFSDWAAE